MAKVYSVFLCVLLIPVLFFPLTSAGRVLLDKPQKYYGSGEQSRNKIEVKGSSSRPDHSATGHSSPFHATPSNSKRDVVPGANAKGTSYASDLKGRVYGTHKNCDPNMNKGCR